MPKQTKGSLHHPIAITHVSPSYGAMGRCAFPDACSKRLPSADRARIGAHLLSIFFLGVIVQYMFTKEDQIFLEGAKGIRVSNFLPIQRKALERRETDGKFESVAFYTPAPAIAQIAYCTSACEDYGNLTEASRIICIFTENKRRVCMSMAP